MTSTMRTLTGIGVSPGSAIGPVAVVQPPQPLPATEPCSADPQQDLTRVADSLSVVADDLDAKAAKLEGDAAEMVAAAAMIARDPGLIEAVEQNLDGHTGPAHALQAAVAGYAEQFEALGGYFAERVADLRDVGMRAEAVLLGRPVPGVPELTEPSIVVAEDLAPAETALLSPELVLGIITSGGGRTSHTAILAAQRGLPAAVQVAGALEIPDGTTVALDGESGAVVLDPDETVKTKLRARSERLAQLSELTSPGSTSDGYPVALLANIGDVNDARAAALTAAEGVGLFRTEFVFLDAQNAPGVAEQADLYEAVLAPFGTRPVTVRTLDAGADKPLAFADLGPEPNPALGRRGYRLMEERPDLLRDQLAALAEAQCRTGASVKVMAPMIATADQARAFAEAAHGAGLPVAGIMIEVPSAALRSRHLLAACDFASIGTNDLSQYTMAADRMVGELADLLDPFQPAVIDLVAAACEGGRINESPVGVCGESAGDPLMALVLTGLGVSSLSMSPKRMPLVRFALGLHELATCRAMAEATRACVDAAEARAGVADLAQPELRELLGV